MASLGYRFKHFVKKQERWFTFAGAFIVVMTFIVKEGLGESWSSLARTIDTADYMYSIHTELSYLKAWNNGFDYKVSAKLSSINKKLETTGNSFQEADPNFPLLMSQQLYNDIKYHCSDVRILIDKLPQEESGKVLSRLCSEIPKAKIENDFVIRSSITTADKQDPPKQWVYISQNSTFKIPDPPETDPIKNRAMMLRRSLDYLNSDITARADKLLQQAKTIRHDNGEYSEYAWRTSVVLFALGWSVGLLGKIYGVQAAGGE
jgi:hypothetical protein